MGSSLAWLHLEIEVASEPIAGLVRGQDEPPRPFHGWIELAQLIERARLRAGAGASAGAEATPEILGPFPGANGAEL